MPPPIEIDVWQGDIGELEVDALIIPANESLFMTAGPAAAVRRRSGEELEREAVAQGPIAPGSAVVTGGGPLAAAYVIHAVAVGHNLRADPGTLRRAVDAALAFAEPLQLRRVAIACLGTEHGAFAPDDAATILVEALLAREADVPEWVVVATANPAETRAVAAALDRARVTG
jgi:O-acetyl-ADP-ribose deacetylase (regulator of RNase III)